MNDRNLLKGLFLALIALVFGLGALKYQIGHLQRPGPGFFPLLMSSILFLLGLSMVVRSRFMKKKAIEFNWKNLAIILGSLAGFAVLSAYVNMISGIVFLVFGSAFAGTSYSVKRCAMTSAVLVGIAFIFEKGLGLQLPLF